MFDRRRTPLTVWFEACWMFASQKDGLSALSLQSYLNEFVFRFNRRRSRSRGRVFYRVLAVAHAPVRYRDLVADPRPKRKRPSPPGRRGHPPSLDRPPSRSTVESVLTCTTPVR